MQIIDALTNLAACLLVLGCILVLALLSIKRPKDKESWMMAAFMIVATASLIASRWP